MADQPIQLGWAPYWNMLPLKHEFSQRLGSRVEFELGHPSEINLWTRTGMVDMAPCSSICLLKYPEMQMAMPIGIAAANRVQSVYIGFSKYPPHLKEYIDKRLAFCHRVFEHALEKHSSDLRTAGKLATKLIFEKPPVLDFRPPSIFFTSASETSVGLAKLIWRFLFGKDVLRDVDKSQGIYTAQLYIGDEALEKSGDFVKTLDLAETWHKLTDLPFVFALMQSLKFDLPSSIKEKMLAAADLAQARMRIEPSAYFSSPLPKDNEGHAIDLACYWKHLHYRLTRQDLKGLMLFLSLICEAHPKSDLVTNKLVSLQEMSVSG